MTKLHLIPCRTWRGERRFGSIQPVLVAALALPMLLGGCSSWFFGDRQLEPQRINVTDKREADPSFPNLASVPDQPPLPSPSAQRAETLAGLSADRQNARYSTDPVAPQAAAPQTGPAYPPAPSLAPSSDAEQGDAAPDPTDKAQLFGEGDAAYQTSPELLQYEAFRQEALAQQRIQQMQRERRAFEQQARQEALDQQRQREQVIQQQAAQRRYPALHQPAYRQPAPPPAGQAQEALAGQPVSIPSIAPAAGPYTAPFGDTAAYASAPPVFSSGQLIGLIYFGHGSAGLDQRDIEVLREVAALQRQQGRNLRIVGHSSSRTGGVLAADHELVNMSMSVERANSVAAALTRQGVDRSRLLVEGFGDTQPVYHEFTATGEAGNRRVEIFLE